MKIVAGMGSIDDYIPFVEAGADEIFCGYVPGMWAMKYGVNMPLNRREVVYYNVQLGALSELDILHNMIQDYGVPVSLTFNALYYRKEQYPMIGQIIQQCVEHGFNSFIIADPGLIYYLYRQPWYGQVRVTVSGEIGEINEPMIEKAEKIGISRVIFHRQMTIEGMKACTQHHNIEFEAFAMNEKCHFHGGMCNSLHCDELAHSCQIPYRLGKRNEAQNLQPNAIFSQKVENEMLTCSTGATGCGICSFWDLKDAGITHLKIVGRGNYTEEMEKDIRQVKKALNVLAESSGRERYIKQVMKALFPDGCSFNCYYRS